MSRFKLEAGSPTLINGNDILILGPVAMDLKSRDPFRFTGTVASGKATFRLLGSLTETTYPGGGDWSEIRRFSASDLEGVAFVNQEYPYVVVLASQTVEGEDANVSAHIGHLVGGDVGDFDPLAIAGDYIPGKRVENILFANYDVRKPFEDLWKEGGERILHNTPAISEIRTYNAQDGFGGTGANLAVIEGVVDNGGVWELAVEAVPLVAGATAYTVQQFVFMHRAVIQCGSNGTNFEDVEFYHGTNTDIQLKIGAEDGNITHGSHFLVPDNHRGFISHLSLMGSRNREIEAEFMVWLPDLQTWISSHPMLLYDSIMLEKDITVVPFAPRSYTKMRAKNRTGGAASVSGRYTLILEELP